MKVLLILFSVGCLLGSVGIVVRGVLGVREDGWSEVPLLVRAEGEFHQTRGRNYVHIGSSPHEGSQHMLRFVSEQWGDGLEHITEDVQAHWLCRYYQGQTPAFCVAGPGAIFPNKEAAQPGELWFPRGFRVNEGERWPPMDGAP